jgi:hypothetical protein
LLFLDGKPEGTKGTSLIDVEIAKKCQCDPKLVYTVSKQYVEYGLYRVLTRKKREAPPVPPQVTGEVEANIIAMACGQPLEGYNRWTLWLYEEHSKKFVGIQLSDTKIREVLKTPFKPHLKDCWCIPPKQNAEFVSRMENVLEVYKRPYNKARPVIYMGEKPVQLLADQRPGQPMTPTHNRREDSEYIRCGVCSVFMFNEPIGGKR